MLYSRITSGLDFFDASTGGLYGNRTYLLRGPSLSGRSTVALQFLTAGIAEGENALMICSEQIENVILKAENGGLPISDHLLDNRLILMEYPREIVTGQASYATIVKLLGEIEEYLNYYRCSRLVFDTLIPLLARSSEPHLINFIYSLMSSIDAFNATTMVVIGEPGSPTAMRIAQLLEDSVVGSFSIGKIKSREGTQSVFQVHKLVNPITPPTTFKIRFDYGTGIVQDLGDGDLALLSDAQPTAQTLAELPLNILLLDAEEESVEELEEIFHRESLINRFDSEDETLAHLRTIDCDLLIANGSQPGVNFKRLLVRIREKYPKLPVFFVADGRSSRLTAQVIRQNGGDGLFFKPLVGKEVLGAFEKSLKQYGKLEQLIEKRKVVKRPHDLPEDMEGFGVGASLSTNGDATSGVLSIPEFRDVLQRQIYRVEREDSLFALVSFKIIYMGEFGAAPHLPQGLELVRMVAGAVSLSLRGLNDRACRYMDKIVVLLEHSDQTGARAFANRVVNELKGELQRRMSLQLGRNINVMTAIAVYPGDGNNAAELLHAVTEVTRNFVKATA
ncbi:MAG: response regulator [Calditrichaeota bacterium]|nr:response regulator [Calditrichota bacterium]